MKLKQVDTDLGQFTININNRERTGNIVVSEFFANKYPVGYKEYFFFCDQTGEFFAKYGTQAAWIRLP